MTCHPVVSQTVDAIEPQLLNWNSISVYCVVLSIVNGTSFCIGSPNSSESDHLGLSYDVIAVFKMATVSHVGFALGWWQPTYEV